MSTEKLSVIVRPARVGDGPEIANVHLNSWQETYEGLLPKSYLDTMPLTFKSRTNFWSNLIDEKPQGREIWVAESKKHGIVGFSTVEVARDRKFSGYGELGAIYLLKHYQGSGVGFKLLRAAFSHLKENGLSKAYCWVLKNNPTIFFYEKSGGRVTDDLKIDKRDAVELIELACVWENLSFF